VYDVQLGLAVSIIDPLDVVRLFIPRPALERMATELGAARIGRLDVVHGAANHDPVIQGLISSLLPALGAPDAASGLFVDHVFLAVAAHIGRQYGRMDAAAPASCGKLAPWQERRAKDVLEAHLQSGLRLADAASACGLSASHFARAFKQSTGQPPHRWLLHRRAERAKELLRGTDATLAETALACGFADQSHFSRVFARIVGVSPGAWRRGFDSSGKSPQGVGR
jgi:AraC-like DNA-binding protein